MRILVNERPLDVAAGTGLRALRDQVKPDADILILNGAAMAVDATLVESDQVVLIRRGEIPAPEEMEALLAARHTPGVHARVKQATVGIAGLGGLGSAVAIALTRIGIGRLVLADFDVVEPSNLNRQQYFLAQIGQRKTEALASTLAAIHPQVRLNLHPVRVSADNVGAIFTGVEVLIEAFDGPVAKADLVRGFSQAHPTVPVVMASGLGGHGPGGTLVVHRLSPTLYVIGDLTSAARPGVGLMAPRVGVAAHLQANVALRLLLGEEGA